MMNDRVVEERRGDLLLSTERTLIDRETVLRWLNGSHWGAAMTRDLLDRAIENSVCVAVYDLVNAGAQLAFARAITDLATYAYWTDVIVAEEARGKGIGSWMVQAMIAHPDMQGFRRVALWSRDPAEHYKKLGLSTDIPA
jgi:GNAT superfamily N-acetyltransferase